LIYITKLQFTKKASEIDSKHWATQPLDSRWMYHKKAIEILKSLNITTPDEILEIGTVGVQIAPGSHTLDRDGYWEYTGKNPTYLHDARITPWPTKKKYEAIIALRVFQYLAPNQKEAFLECKRNCKHLILITPTTKSYKPKGLEGSKGIMYEEFLEWNNNIHPKIYEPTSMGDFYHWDFT